MFSIRSVLPEFERLKIVDIGAMSLGEGTEPYANLLKAGPCEVLGFEPIQIECKKLNQSAKPHYKFIPCAIGDGAKHTFY